MNDGFEGEFASTGDDRAAERNGARLAKFAERSVAAAFFNRTRNALRQEQSPRNDVAVPRVHDHIDILVEKVAINGLEMH